MNDSGYRNLCKIGEEVIRTVICSSLIYIGQRVLSSTKSHSGACKEYAIKFQMI
jgi:hypothetical protein